MDARSSVGGFLSDHAEDEIPNYLGGRSSPDRLPDLRNQRPIPTESSPLPPDHGFGCDDGECLFPAGPEPRNEQPENLSSEYSLEHG